jgi:hypothetical protein
LLSRSDFPSDLEPGAAEIYTPPFDAVSSWVSSFKIRNK